MHSGADYLRFLRDLLDGTRARHERMLDGWRTRDVGPYLDLNAPLRVLDLANGRLRPQLPLLAAAGHRVFGLDLANRQSRDAIDILHRPARWLYETGLGLANGVSTAFLVAGRADAIPFADGSFDLVTSIAAFEHFLDMSGVLDEVRRVLRPGGVLWACIHLFTSLSGGHNIGYARVPVTRLPRGVQPWDHLRERHLPFDVPLNQWRRDQYLEAISSRFRILTHYSAIREGEGLLDAVLEAQMAGYDASELTAAAYVVAAAKP